MVGAPTGGSITLGSASPRSVLMSLRDTWKGLHYAVGLLLGWRHRVFIQKFGVWRSVARFVDNELKFNLLNPRKQLSVGTSFPIFAHTARGDC